MNKIKLPSDIQFLEDARLIIYRPTGVLSEEAVDEVIVALGKLEFSLPEPQLYGVKWHNFKLVMIEQKTIRNR